jgi:hypothetical protein
MTDTIPLPAEDPFRLVATPFSPVPMEAWRAAAMATGSAGALSAFHQMYQAVRNDAATLEAEAHAHEPGVQEQVHKLCDQVAGWHERIPPMIEELESLRQFKADAEAKAARQARFDTEPIEEPPGTQDASVGHEPTGDLHALPAKDEEEPLPVPDEEEPELTENDQTELLEPTEDLETVLGDARRRAPSRHRATPAFRSPVAVEDR